MYICTISTKILNTIVKYALDAGKIKETPFFFDENGLRIKALDPSHVAMVFLKIPKDQFETYNLTESITMNIEFDEIKKRLKVISSKSIEIHYDNKEQLFIMKAGATELSLPLIGELPNIPELPDLKPKLNLIKVPCAEIQSALKTASIVDDLVKITVSKKNLNIHTTRDKTKSSTNIKISYNKAEEYFSQFDLGFLNDAVQLMPSDSDLDIYIGNDVPLWIDFDIGSYFIAPRVEGD